MDFWNFKDLMIVASHNWLWVLLALILGLVVGWITCRHEDQKQQTGNG